ncbi:uncharacterized protein B0I36DRAFT_335590 [Microdochium trichocladiopsis]|uniref:Uncharacterized protein n=1 Tax=Microdochium trichocladiopsis TaxID=1682393 RepID=A0A9P9BJM9_9PEZI|nr:uncharacterized protein B0I36DRAFT_335590 [Microdochium trichocladiopsis]KAH7018255.1 hypothetical protein B0I36DRAFT_335590 [Microdochium trichocladiopsis]
MPISRAAEYRGQHHLQQAMPARSPLMTDSLLAQCTCLGQTIIITTYQVPSTHVSLALAGGSPHVGLCVPGYRMARHASQSVCRHTTSSFLSMVASQICLRGLAGCPDIEAAWL